MRTSDGLLILEPDEGRADGDVTVKVDSNDTRAGWGVVTVRGSRGTSGQTHLHPGQPEAFFLLEGEVELWGQESVTTLGPGTFAFVPPDTEHALKVMTDEARWLAIWPAALQRVPGTRRIPE